jgi:hypothetical protein
MKIYFLSLVHNDKDNDETFLILKLLFSNISNVLKNIYASYSKPPL